MSDQKLRQLRDRCQSLIEEIRTLRARPHFSYETIVGDLRAELKKIQDELLIKSRLDSE